RIHVGDVGRRYAECAAVGIEARHAGEQCAIKTHGSTPRSNGLEVLRPSDQLWFEPAVSRPAGSVQFETSVAFLRGTPTGPIINGASFPVGPTSFAGPWLARFVRMLGPWEAAAVTFNV